MHKFVFVLEQSLGHVAHSRNLERLLATQPDIEATVIKISYTPPAAFNQVPGLRSWSFRASRAARSALLRRIEGDQVDALFIHTQVAALLVVDLMQRIPTVVSLDATPLNFDVEGPSYGHRRGAEVIERTKKRINARTFTAAAALVAWCRWAARSLVSDYGVAASKVQVIRPGVDLNLFRPADQPASGGVPRILFVGGDFIRKGGPELLAATGRLSGRVELDIVTGSEVSGVPPGLCCRIHRGLEPQSERLVDLYRRADIFVLPSRGDVFPQVVAEALACSVPVITSAVGALPEMVRDGENGYLVPVRSPRQLGRAIEALVEHPVLRKAMGERGRALAVREHDASRNGRAIFALMRELADNAHSRRSA